jgi:type III pantothenate kinase
VSAAGEYIGGAICPGIGISSEALFRRTARLPQIDIREPASVIGASTVTMLQSGLYYGTLGMVDSILERMLRVLGENTKIVATGGQARVICPGSRYIRQIEDNLTLDGLRLIWDRHAARG